jgi:hypothetical protein
MRENSSWHCAQENLEEMWSYLFLLRWLKIGRKRRPVHSPTKGGNVSEPAMEKSRVRRFPNVNVNALKSCFPEEATSKGENRKNKTGKKHKKMTKADKQREALFPDKSNDSETVTVIDSVSEKSEDNDAALLDVTSTGIEEDMEVAEGEAEHFSAYPTPAEVIDCKKLTKDTVLVGLPEGATVFFKGCLQVRVIRGCLEAFGQKLSPGAEDTTRLYSPRGSSLLPLKAFQLSKGNAAEAAEPEEVEAGVRGDCLFIAKRLSESWMEYVQSHMKKSWKISLFGRDQEKEEETEAVFKLKEMEKTLNITCIDPAR